MALVTGTLGATLYVAALPLTATQVATGTITDFQQLIYTQVGLVENLGEFGRVSEVVTFVDISNARTTKLRGPFNDGQMNMTVGADLSDAGQQILFQANNSVSQNNYGFKVVIVGTNAYYDGYFFGAGIFSFRFQPNAANSVFRALVSLEVNTEVFVGDAQ